MKFSTREQPVAKPHLKMVNLLNRNGLAQQIYF